jgi:cytochrome c biogenesis protein
MVKVDDFDAPRRADGSFADFATHMTVYRDGAAVASKTIRVNDPLSVDGYVFHQNTFGPAVDLTVRDAAGALAWSGNIILAGQVADRPQGFLTIPGTSVGLVVVLDRAADGAERVVLQGVGPPSEAGAGGETLFLATLPVGGATDPSISADHEIAVAGIGSWSGLVVKNDPGQPLIWIAFGLLISGLVLTFYFPRRRAWARIEGGDVALAFIADRYVDRDREFERLHDRVAVALGAGPATKTDLRVPQRDS